MVRGKGKVRRLEGKGSRFWGLWKCLYGKVAKNLQNFASGLRFKLGVTGGSQKGITLLGRISGSFHTLGLRKWVAKNVQIFCI